MTTITLKDLAELAGMTGDEISTLCIELREKRFSSPDAYAEEKLLALAFIKTRRDELSKFNGAYPPDITVRISTLTEALKAGGRE